MQLEEEALPVLKYLYKGLNPFVVGLQLVSARQQDELSALNMC